MKHILPLVLLLSATFATQCFAEQTDGQKAFKTFAEFMVGGVWTRTDDDGNELEHVYRWAAHKRCVVMRTVSDPDAGTGMIYVDLETEKCVWHGFNHGPERGAMAAESFVESTGPNQWKVTGKSVGKDSVRVGEWKVTTNDERDELHVEGQSKLNGKEEDPVDVTWRRRKNTATKKEFAEFLRAMEGKWVGNVTLPQDIPGIGKKGQKVKVTGENTLTPNGKGLAWQGSDDQGGTANSLAYYAANARQIRRHTVFSGGTVVSTTIVKDGERWLAHHVSTDPDGKVTRATDVLEISNGGKTHTWKREGAVANVWQRQE